jgi:multicomponent Na+:H+ antiporter subunit D
MAVGALLLAGLPFGLMDYGSAIISEGAHAAEKPWIEGMVLFGAGCTGAAVLRVAGRVFLGFGQVPGEEDRAPTEDEQEKADRPLWLMLLPTIVLLGLALALGAYAHDFVPHAAGKLMQAARPDIELGPMEPESSPWPWLTVALAVGLAIYFLGRRQMPDWFRRGMDWVVQPVASFLNDIHSGLIVDYVTWVVVGLALFTIAFALV